MPYRPRGCPRIRRETGASVAPPHAIAASPGATTPAAVRPENPYTGREDEDLHLPAHHRERRRGAPHVPPEDPGRHRRPPGGGERRRTGRGSRHARPPPPGGGADGGAGPYRLRAPRGAGPVCGTGGDGSVPGGGGPQVLERRRGDTPLHGVHRAGRQRGVLPRGDLRVAEAQRGSRPSLLDAAFLARRYRDEFGLVEIPAPVQRLVFPVLVAIGTLLGRYDRYTDAPEPVRR